jgi:YjbE family integral membrane protein
MSDISAALPGLLEIIWLNLVLSGDNAVVIGLAAAGLPAAQRRRAVAFGILAAAVLRIGFSLFASYLLALWWVDIAGGLALLAIAGSFLRELLAGSLGHGETAGEAAAPKSLAAALWQIVVADVSMSLDNVLAVAAVARANVKLLVVGLLLSVGMIGLLGAWLARLLDRYRIIAYIGVALIAWIGLELLWEGILASNAHLGLGLPLPAAR